MAYSNGSPTLANSWPDDDGWFSDDYWTKQDWITWHGAMVKAYGKEKANQRWKTAWDSVGHTGVEKMPVTGYAYDKQFVNYFKSQGIDITNVVSAVLTGAQNLIDTGIHTTENVAANVGRGAENLTDKIADWVKHPGRALVVVVVVLALGAAIFYAVKSKVQKSL